jgi:RimJ/RimL family protein N-acetyltransferase
MASLFGFRPKEDPRPDDEPWPAAVWPIPAEAELRGQVVTLRPITAADHPELLHALDSPKVWQHLPTPRPQSVDDLSRIVDSVRARGFHPWVLRLSADLETDFGRLPAGTVVGWSSYLEVAPGDARLEIGNTAYAPAVWGTAVNPEAKLLLLGYAFEGLSMGRVQLKTDIRNVRSQRAIAGLGATYEGTLRRYQRRADGTMRDSVLFSITAEEWPSVRRSLEARVGASSRES